MGQSDARQRAEQLLKEGLSLKDGEGRVVIRLCLLSTVYFEGAHRPEVREAAADCFEAYRELCGPSLRWAKHPETFDWLPIDSPEVPPLREWLGGLPPGAEWEFACHGGEDPSEASDFSARALGSAEGRAALSYFRATVPITWLGDHKGGFESLMLKFCQLLRPLSGYGGVGIVESPDGSIGQKFEPAVYALARRFPGLEIDYPPVHTIHLTAGIKGVNWLTFVGGRWLAPLGGADALRAKLGPEYEFEETPAGLLIRAGERPQLGDAEQDRYPELYVRLASALRPVRVKEHGSLHHLGPDRFDDETTLLWLARFDRE